jgi:hypothetical protein
MSVSSTNNSYTIDVSEPDTLSVSDYDDRMSNRTRSTASSRQKQRTDEDNQIDLNLLMTNAKKNLILALEENEIFLPLDDEEAKDRVNLSVDAVLFNYSQSIIEYEGKYRQEMRGLANGNTGKPILDISTHTSIKYRNAQHPEIRNNNNTTSLETEIPATSFVTEPDYNFYGPDSTLSLGIVLDLKDKLRKQKDLTKFYESKMKEIGEKLRRNDVQMDFLRGQLLRRDQELKNQRESFYKEIFLLREQVC